MSSGAVAPSSLDPRVLEIVKRYWGYDRLRPLQAEAIGAGLAQRDSLVVLPTGGGKSLCYQVPPAVLNRTDIVVSPLISLMKDQVDGLRECGYPTAAVHSGMSAEDRAMVERGIADGAYRLVFVAPERLLGSWFMNLVSRANVRSFAIDEAHCVSHWGHDFRPEYRQLRALKERFPGASVHAYTATATQRVRDDIIEQLGLNDAVVLVGNFDRPNLTYRVQPRTHIGNQALQVIHRHAGEAVIIYCLSRNDTESLALFLQQRGVKAAHYHAGMDADARHRVQDAFADESLDVVVATVAFGMGIDRSNVRCVIHATMPKSIEHYQQETGRAGRDGLEAECILFYSGSDVMRWEGLITKSASEASEGADIEAIIAPAMELLDHMQRLASNARCRHRALVEYFGQTYDASSCNACDVCLNEIEAVPDSTLIAQKILSCVARVQQRFGVMHIVEVLSGANTEMIRKCRHEQLSTYGLLKELPKAAITNYVYQLVDQGMIARSPGDRPILSLNDASTEILKGRRQVKLLRPPESALRASKTETASWENVDQGLFERLRELRRTIAHERGVPPFVVFSDAVLRGLASARPTTAEGLRGIRGIGEKKASDLGDRFIAAIAEYCAAHNVRTNLHSFGEAAPNPVEIKFNPIKDEARAMFARGCTIDQVMLKTGRARSTVSEYLVEFIATERPESVAPWVDQAIYDRVVQASLDVNEDRLRPVFDKLEGAVPYDHIKIVLTHVRVRSEVEAAR
jgi:ATP-dependent DNA helicase RecQ